MNKEEADKKVIEALDICKSGNHERAVEIFQEIISACPQHVDAYYCLADIKSKIFKDYNSAIYLLKKVIEMGPLFDIYKSLAENYLLKADLSNALKYLKMALIYDSNSKHCQTYLTRYFPKEANYIDNTRVEYSKICNAKSCENLTYHKIYDAGIICRKKPKYIESLLTEHQKQVLEACINHMSQLDYNEGFVAKIPNGKVYLKQSDEPVILTEDNTFLSDTSNYPYKEFEPLENSVNVADNLLVLSTCYGGNFYHWLTWVVPKLYMTEKAGYNLKSFDKIAINYIGFKFQKELISLLNIPMPKIIGTIPNGVVLNAKNLVASSTPSYDVTPPIVIEALRSKFLNSKMYDNNSPKKIYLSRNKSATRHILNEEEFANFLNNEGFTTIYAEDLTFSEQVKMFANAEFVIAPHGAGLVNLAFCSSKTKVIEIHNEYEWWKQKINPDNTVTLNQKSDGSFMRIASDNDLDHYIMYGDVDGNDMSVDMDKFKATYSLTLEK